MTAGEALPPFVCVRLASGYERCPVPSCKASVYVGRRPTDRMSEAMRAHITEAHGEAEYG